MPHFHPVTFVSRVCGAAIRYVTFVRRSRLPCRGWPHLHLSRSCHVSASRSRLHTCIYHVPVTCLSTTSVAHTRIYGVPVTFLRYVTLTFLITCLHVSGARHVPWQIRKRLSGRSPPPSTAADITATRPAPGPPASCAARHPRPARPVSRSSSSRGRRARSNKPARTPLHP